MAKLTFNRSAGIDSSELDNFHFSFRTEFGETYAQLQHSEYKLFEFTGEFNGYIPFLLRKSKLINTVKFLFNPVNKNGGLFQPQEENAILESFLEHIKCENYADRILQPMNWMLFQSSPEKSIKVPFGSYKIDLKLGEEEVWKKLHTKHRNVIRNAGKKGAQIVSGLEQLDVFYELYQSTMRRSNMYCEPKEFFTQLVEKCSSNIFIAVVYNGETPIGALCVPYSKFGAYYVYGASADKINLTGAINFLHFELIKFLIRQKVEYYDFVGARLSDISGTKFEGIQKFKARFGGELFKGELWKIDINPLKCRLYDNALKIKMKMKRMNPTGDIIDQEAIKIYEK